MPAADILHEDSTDLTPLAQDTADPIEANIAEVDGEVKAEQEGELYGDEDEDMDEMGSVGDGEDYEMERARIIKWA
jgi:predicted transglutaminase-like cysteine proteinase